MNLVVNARDAMPEGGRVVIRTRLAVLGEDAAARLSLRPGRHVELSVSDTGPGIHPEHRSRIFEPYFTTKQEAGLRGTGLGLAMVYGIVEAHGGAIEVLDAAPRGALMRAYLPAADVEALPSSRAAPPQPRSGRGTILVVDDERLVLEASSRALRTLGYDVLEAEGGVPAIETFRANRDAIHGVLLDMMMPDLDGASTLNALRAIDPAVRVLVATGGDPSGSESPSWRGVCGFLSKPYDLGTLSEAIAHLTSDRADVLYL
jgi:CheY-like chemotaxis protein